MNFEHAVAKSWTGWDRFGSDWHFSGCVLNPDFFTEEQWKDVSTMKSPTVSIFMDENSAIEIGDHERYVSYEFKLVQVKELKSGKYEDEN